MSVVLGDQQAIVANHESPANERVAAVAMPILPSTKSQIADFQGKHLRLSQSRKE